jgi:hypothetical protein
VESLKDGWAGSHVGQALYTVQGDRMTIRLAKSTVGLNGQVSTLCFKWADNSTLSGNVMEFMDLGDTAPNDRFSYLYVCPEGEGDFGVSTPSYELMAADGAKVESRDETKPLPGFGSGEEPTDTTAPDGDATDAPAEPDTNAPDESDKAPDAGDSTPSVVWKYSTRLKVMILATGAVVGLSLYAAIVVPFFVKKKRASR